MDLNFNKNEDYNKLQIAQLKKKLLKVYKGGGTQKIEKHKAKGKLTARERIAYLFDKKRTSIEIGAFAGEDMYQEHGGCPSAGVVVKIGYIKEKQCIVVANDATVKAGAWFPITAKKNLRAQEIAIENRLPIIYLVDSAGVYLPMQDEIFPDKEHFGRIFRNNAVMSSMGITQISAVMGSCVAGGAYLPIMSDEAMIVDKTGSIFLAGSYLVKAAIGESIDNETLGGASTHCEISGVTDYKAIDDHDALDKTRSRHSGGLHLCRPVERFPLALGGAQKPRTLHPAIGSGQPPGRLRGQLALYLGRLGHLFRARGAVLPFYAALLHAGIDIRGCEGIERL